jgi:hypothetical protein
MGIMQAGVGAAAASTGIVVPFLGWFALEYVPGGSDAVASFSIAGDGSWSWVGNNIQRTGSVQWYTPITGGIGAGYWVRMISTYVWGSGLTGPAKNTWLPLTSTRTWLATSPNSSNQLNGEDFIIQIATDAAGANIVAQDSQCRVRAVSYFYDPPPFEGGP